MSDVYPALRGKMGHTEYFVLTVKARALVGLVTFQTTEGGWEWLTLEERDQRDINLPRVRNQIAPYLRNDPNHFMGAVVLQADKLANDCFGPLVGPGGVSTDAIARPYKASAMQFGFLHLGGGEIFKPLDGQHRLKALEFAIKGQDDRGEQLPPAHIASSVSASSSKDAQSLKGSSSREYDGRTAQIADEDVAVIIVKASLDRARKIFTDINSYAKPTTTGQNLITNDSETHAVLARKLTNDVIGARLVMYKTNNLTDKDYEFTTLSTISKGIKEILKVHFPHKKFDKYPPRDEERVLLWKTTKDIWEKLLDGFELWSIVLEDKHASGDGKRKELRRENLCLRPVPQLCIIQAYIFVTLLSEHKISGDEAIKRLNKIPWGTDDPLWDRVLWSSGKVQTKNAKLVTELITYLLLGDNIGKRNKEKLLEKYKSVFPPKQQLDPDFGLPTPIQ